MRNLAALTIAMLFAANLAYAQATPATPAQPAAAAAPAAGGCEGRAIGKNGKPLAGAAKAAFMKKCMRDNPSAAPAAPARTAQQDKMKQCNADAAGKKGDARKAFMKDCLSK